MHKGYLSLFFVYVHRFLFVNENLINKQDDFIFFCIANNFDKKGTIIFKSVIPKKKKKKKSVYHMNQN